MSHRGKFCEFFEVVAGFIEADNEDFEHTIIYRIVKGVGPRGGGSLIFPKVPQSSQTESLGFPSYLAKHRVYVFFFRVPNGEIIPEGAVYSTRCWGWAAIFDVLVALDFMEISKAKAPIATEKMRFSHCKREASSSLKFGQTYHFSLKQLDFSNMMSQIWAYYAWLQCHFFHKRTFWEVNQTPLIMTPWFVTDSVIFWMPYKTFMGT